MIRMAPRRKKTACSYSAHRLLHQLLLCVAAWAPGDIRGLGRDDALDLRHRVLDADVVPEVVDAAVPDVVEVAGRSLAAEAGAVVVGLLLRRHETRRVEPGDGHGGGDGRRRERRAERR